MLNMIAGFVMGPSFISTPVSSTNGSSRLLCEHERGAPRSVVEAISVVRRDCVQLCGGIRLVSRSHLGSHV